jgi:hypothetical protein
MYVCVSVRMSICLSVCPSVYLVVCPSSYLSACPSVCAKQQRLPMQCQLIERVVLLRKCVERVSDLTRDPFAHIGQIVRISKTRKESKKTGDRTKKRQQEEPEMVLHIQQPKCSDSSCVSPLPSLHSSSPFLLCTLLIPSPLFALISSPFPLTPTPSLLIAFLPSSHSGLNSFSFSSFPAISHHAFLLLHLQLSLFLLIPISLSLPAVSPPFPISLLLASNSNSV